MSFRPTAVLNGARRRILNSKEGPISFYKGTGNHPALGLKRQGRHAPGRAGKQYQLNEDLIRTFVVPKGLGTTTLRPYVELKDHFTPVMGPKWLPRPSKDGSETLHRKMGDVRLDGDFMEKLLKRQELSRPQPATQKPPPAFVLSLGKA